MVNESIFIGCGLGSFIWITKMNSHSAGLDDPQGADDGARFQDREEVSQAVKDGRNTAPRTDLQDNHARALLGRKSGHLAEIMIQGDQGPALAGTGREQPLIRRASEALVTNGHHIVTGRLQ